MKERKKRISFSYPEELKKELIKVAKKEKMKLASLIKEILCQHIEDLRRQNDNGN
jgi:predicted DNA-binding protein